MTREELAFGILCILALVGVVVLTGLLAMAV